MDQQEHEVNLGLIPHVSSISGLELGNLVVAFCLDGTVYGLDAASGDILWRSSGSFTEGPLLKKRRLRVGEWNFDYLVEPIGDGAIFQVEAGEGKEVKRLPFTLKSLVHSSPFHWRECEERALYLIAKRESSIFVLDLLSGRVRKRQIKRSDSRTDNEEGLEVAPLDRASLLIGRSDYHLQGFDEKNLEAEWEITLTQFKGLHESDTSANLEEFYTTFNGHLVSKEREGAWIAKLASPVLQLFRPMQTTSGRITLQEIVLKGTETDGSVEKRVLFDKNRVTFYFDDLVNVGMLNGPDNDNVLFVLPQSHYPMLNKKKQMIEDDSRGLVVRGHRFMSVQRVIRQVVAPEVKLLGYDGDVSMFGIKMYGSLGVLILSILVLWVMKKRRQLRQDVKDQDHLEVSEEVLGYGSHGTVVFKGKFDGRPVAVKRLLSQFYSLADHEISLLQAHDMHPNVIRYFWRERKDQFIFVALELAKCSLHEFIDPTADGANSTGGSDNITNTRVTGVDNQSVDKVDLLEQVMKGLEFLHEKGLVHRDLKPQNILLQFDNSKLRVLISDFGLSRKLVEMESSFHATAQAAGTLGWRAPEIIFNEESVRFRDESTQTPAPSGIGPMKIGKSVDIFATGLIFYFVLSGGRHAFGPRLLRESNISTGKLQIDSSLLSAEADDLIQRMLRKRAKDRPSSSQVLGHPFFWSGERRLEFICAVSDVLEAEERNLKREQVEKAPPGFEFDTANTTNLNLPLRDSIDAVGSKVFAPTWHKDLDRLIFQDLTRHRYYMVNKLHDLLRAIRNKRNHFHETPDAVQELLGASPLVAWRYFEKKFPCLLMECYKVMRECEELSRFYRD